MASFALGCLANISYIMHNLLKFISFIIHESLEKKFHYNFRESFKLSMQCIYLFIFVNENAFNEKG